MRTKSARPALRDEEVVDQRAVAGDGLGADPGRAGDEVVGAQLGDEAPRLGDEGARFEAAWRSSVAPGAPDSAARAARCPGQASVSRRSAARTRASR